MTGPAPAAGAAKNSNEQASTTTGSGERYTTTIDRHTRGELKPEDFRQALGRVSETEEALADLLLAQTHGVEFDVYKEEHPLFEAQSALRLAEKQVREEKYEGAKANLRLARVQLEAYRALVGDSGRVRELETQISSVHDKIESPGMADKIRGFWNQVAGFFRQSPGEAHATTGSEDGEEPSEEVVSAKKGNAKRERSE